MNKWFKNVDSIEELRKRYRALLKQYHPDNGGSEEVMKEINAQYDAVFARMSHENNSNGQSYTQEENEQFKAILNKISGFNMTVEVIGNWLWCTDCYPYRNQLKKLGFKWCSRKKAWAWHSEPYHRHHSKEMTLDSIRQKYGSDVINRKTKQPVIG